MINQALKRAAGLLAVACLLSCEDHRLTAVVPTVSSSVLARNLVSPIAVETDPTGRVFVTEQGTGANDGRLTMVGSNGQLYPVVTGFFSEKLPNNEISGTDHLLYADGLLYVLNAKGLYKVNVSGFKPGDAPIAAASLVPEDIGTFVINYKFVNDTDESHLYNLTLGPDGALYITDAAANAIIRRAKNGALSVVAEVPGVPNPTSVGPPVIQAVPTSITYDGKQLLFSTLVGFPFPPGKSVVYAMDLTGKLTVYWQNFTSLVDVENDGNGGILTLQHGVFGPQGFAPNTGLLAQTTAAGTATLLSSLNQPTDLKLLANRTGYLVSLGDNTLLKITF
ncbi:ScyD/ScyE family protein [Spirosoma luteolum]